MNNEGLARDAKPQCLPQTEAHTWRQKAVVLRSRSRTSLGSSIGLQRGQPRPSWRGEGRNDLNSPSAFEVLVEMKREENAAGTGRKCQDS